MIAMVAFKKHPYFAFGLMFGLAAFAVQKRRKRLRK